MKQFRGESPTSPCRPAGIVEYYDLLPHSSRSSMASLWDLGFRDKPRCLTESTCGSCLPFKDTLAGCPLDVVSLLIGCIMFFLWSVNWFELESLACSLSSPIIRCSTSSAHVCAPIKVVPMCKPSPSLSNCSDNLLLYILYRCVEECPCDVPPVWPCRNCFHTLATPDIPLGLCPGLLLHDTTAKDILLCIVTEVGCCD